MKCDWSGGCSRVVTEVWTPREGSNVVDEGEKCFCAEHGLHGPLRAASCMRFGYSLGVHKHALQLEWIISAFRGTLIHMMPALLSSMSMSASMAS